MNQYNPKRISDARSHGIAFISPEYPTVCPFNADNSRLLLVHVDHYGLYTGDGEFLRELPIAANGEARWSADPNVLYYVNVNVNALYAYNLTADSIDLVQVFKNYKRISGHGESDTSPDGNHLVLSGDHKEVFIFNASTKEILTSIETDGRFDGLYLTDSLSIVITWNQETGRGITLTPLAGPARQIAPVLSHQDVTVGLDGNPYLVWANAPDPSVNNNGIEKINLNTGERTLLLAQDWDYAMHISAPANKGWIIVETYDPKGSDRGNILKVGLDGGTEILCHHGSNASTYDGQPKASVSRDGSKLVYGSNMGHQFTDTYLVDLNPAVTTALDSEWKEVMLAPGAQWLLRAGKDNEMEVYDWTSTGPQKIDYSAMEGREWQWRVVGGKLKQFYR